MLPELDGYAVTRSLGKGGSHVPILMLTARDAVKDIDAGLEAGADDYLVKPFALSVLIARLHAVTRRGANPSNPVLRVDDLVLDPAQRDVSRGGKQIHLTATEFWFLEHLMRCAGRVAYRTSIIEAVWGFVEDVEPNTVDTYIKLLRDKIDNGEKTKLIHTIRGYGYVVREYA